MENKNQVKIYGTVVLLCQSRKRALVLRDPDAAENLSLQEKDGRMVKAAPELAGQCGRDKALISLVAVAAVGFWGYGTDIEIRRQRKKSSKRNDEEGGGGGN
ncbi:hypothetical protein R1flu_001580 [Riccia fluitans]|uniref:Uncharacterized protein n=1 Tax=Riccia fluitans TaxID=41844 RepID=A0ABD1Y3N9_9MARC